MTWDQLQDLGINCEPVASPLSYYDHPLLNYLLPPPPPLSHTQRNDTDMHEQSTHTHTHTDTHAHTHTHAGSIYCDRFIMRSGMYGEGVRSGAVIVVKTHRKFGIWTEPDKPAVGLKTVMYL